MGKEKTSQMYVGENAAFSPIERQKSTPKLILYNFTWFDVLVIFVSMTTYIADIVTDILVTILYWKIDEKVWAGLTVFFLIFPSILMQIFSTRWYLSDGRKITLGLIIVHFFMMGPIMRYINALKHGLRAKRTKRIEDYQKTYSELSDASMLRLIESFLESAPQLVLQLYIILKVIDNDHILTSISAFFSLLSLAWAIAAYTKALRMAVVHSENGKKQRTVSWTGLFIQTTWRVGMVSSRIVVLVLFATVHPYWLIGVIVVHWLVMTIWQIHQDTDFCSTIWEERLFNVVIGFIHIFCFINMKEGKSRYRVLPYYTLMLMENSTMVIIWWFNRTPNQWYNDFGMAIVWGGFLVGIVSMILYHQYFHPNSPKRCHCCMAYYHVIYKCCPCYTSKVSFNNRDDSNVPVNIYSNIDASDSVSVTHNSGTESESPIIDTKTLIMPQPNATSTPADFLDSSHDISISHQTPGNMPCSVNETLQNDDSKSPQCNSLVKAWVKKTCLLNSKSKQLGLNGTLKLHSPKKENYKHLENQSDDRNCEILKEPSENKLSHLEDEKEKTNTCTSKVKSLHQMKKRQKLDTRESFRKVFGFQHDERFRSQGRKVSKLVQDGKNHIQRRVDQPPPQKQRKLSAISETQPVERKTSSDSSKNIKLVWKEPDKVKVTSTKLKSNDSIKPTLIFDIPQNTAIFSPYDNVPVEKNIENNAKSEENKENCNKKETKHKKSQPAKLTRQPLGAKNISNNHEENVQSYKPVQRDRLEYLYKIGKNGFKKKCEDSPARRQLSYSKRSIENCENDQKRKMTRSIEGLTESADGILDDSESYIVHIA